MPLNIPADMPIDPNMNMDQIFSPQQGAKQSWIGQSPSTTFLATTPSMYMSTPGSLFPSGSAQRAPGYTPLLNQTPMMMTSGFRGYTPQVVSPSSPLESFAHFADSAGTGAVEAVFDLQKFSGMKSARKIREMTKSKAAADSDGQGRARRRIGVADYIA